MSELELSGMSRDAVRRLIGRMTAAELLVLYEVFNGYVPDIAVELLTGDRVLLTGDRVRLGDSGHIQALVLTDRVPSNLSRLQHLTTVYVADTESNRDRYRLLRRLLDTVPNLEAVYLYEGGGHIPSIKGLDVYYSREFYDTDDSNTVEYPGE